MTTERRNEIAYLILQNQADRAEDPSSVIKRLPENLSGDIGVNEKEILEFYGDIVKEAFSKRFAPKSPPDKHA